MNKNKVKYTEYYILLVAWFFWGISQSLLWIQGSPDTDLARIFLTKLLHTLSCIIINFIIIQILIYLQKRITGKTGRILTSSASIITFSILLVLINLSISSYVKGSDEILRPFIKYIINATEKLIYLAGFSTMFFLIRNLRETKKQKSIIEEARQTARDAQLQMLQQQINPHFLFNILNSLRSLIANDVNRARDMVTDLSDFLRVTLSSYKSVRNTIKDEINLLEYYLSLQKVRFEENIVYKIDVDDNLNHYTVPKYILQPLVENAIKFGMKTSTMPLRINVSVKNAEDIFKILVSNTGSLITSNKEKHSNNGISNIKTRLDLMFPGRTDFTLEENNGCVLATISIISPEK